MLKKDILGWLLYTWLFFLMTLCSFQAQASIHNQRNTSDNPKINISSQDVKNMTAWLQTPITFSKSFMGVSVSNASMIVSTDLAIQRIIFLQILYQSFRKITIGDVTSDLGDNAGQKIEELVRKLARLNDYRNHSESSVEEAVSKEDHVSLRVFITVGTSNQSVNASKTAIEKAINISHRCNSDYPGSVKAIVLNWETYQGDEREIRNSTSGYWHRYMKPSIEHAANMVNTSINSNSSKLELGITLPTQICQFLASAASYPQLGKVNRIIFQETLTIREIAAGTRKLVEKVSQNFVNCRKYVEDNFSKETEVEFRVSPSGCRRERDFSVKEVIELARLWEKFNEWAGNEKSVVTMCTAFDSWDEDDSCGWWKGPGHEEGGRFVFENKKGSKAALELYKKERIEEKTCAHNLLLPILLSTTAFVILVAAIACYFVARYRRQYIIGKEEADEFFKGRGNKEVQSDPLINLPLGDFSSTAHCQHYDKAQYEIRRGDFKIDTVRILGSGAMGLVCWGSVTRKEEGELKEIDVAVKMITERPGGGSCAYNIKLRRLMSEIKILSYVRSHQHIIGLEGAYTAELRKGKVYVFLELCEMGSLLAHLRDFEMEREKEEVETESMKAVTVHLERKNKLDEGLAQDLLRWSQEICSGMEYLASKRVVHADLATRNVLLNSFKSAKISDFGASRRLYDYTNYVKQTQEPLPWRWMSPESLRRLEFNEKTDVWAYGVTLWEMYTLGYIPYAGLTWSTNFCTFLENGLHLEEPVYNENNIYGIMTQCWTVSPINRPTFKEIQDQLTKQAPGSSECANGIAATYVEHNLQRICIHKI